MRKTGLEAANYMKALSQHGATGVRGFCLRTCRLAWDLPGDQPSAIAEWASIPAKYRHTDPMKAPIGAPHFFRGGKYGHVVIQSELEGYVWSTDAPTANKVGLVDIAWFRSHWKYDYLGWSSQFQNHVLPLGAEAPAAPAKKAPAKKVAK